MAIETFTTPENRWLSNMWPLETWIKTDLGISVPSTEHAYQANKFLRPVDHHQIAMLQEPRHTKTLAHELQAAGHPVIPGWNEIKVGVMYTINWQKYTRNPELGERLVATGDEELIEGNTWDDHFWGVDPIGSRDGENHLGKVLMRVRARLIEAESGSRD